MADHLCLLVRLCHSEQAGSTGPLFCEQWMQHVVDADDSHVTSTMGILFVCLWVSVSCSVWRDLELIDGPPVDCLSAQGCPLILLADGMADEPVLRVYALQCATDLYTGISLVAGLDSSVQSDSSVVTDVASAVSELPHYGHVKELDAHSSNKWYI